MRKQQRTRERHPNLLLWVIGALTMLPIAGTSGHARSDEPSFAVSALMVAAPPAETLMLYEVERGLADRFRAMQERREERARHQLLQRDYQPPLPPTPDKAHDAPQVGNDFGTDPFGGVQ